MDQLLRSLVVPDHHGAPIPADSTPPLQHPAAVDGQAAPAATRHTAQPSHIPSTPRSLQARGSAGAMFDFGPTPPNLQSIEAWEHANPPAPPRAVPVPAGPSNPASVIAFYELCTKLGLRPDFTLLEAAPQRFRGKVVVGALAVERAGPFASKKEAKEQVCAAALPLLLAKVERPGAEAPRKRKSAEPAPTTPAGRLAKSELFAEDWVSILMTHLQKQKLPAAEYAEWRTASTPFCFACTLRFQGSPVEPFGAPERFYPNKKEAKKAAARDAVLWLRRQGQLAGDRYAAAANRNKQDGDDGAADGAPALDDESRELYGLPAEPGPTPVPDISLAQQVNEMAASLGLIQPQFAVRNVDATLDSLIDMTVQFHERDIRSDPRLAREIAVKNVYGKKKAKELCCRDVLRLLDEVKRDRAS
nr:hypothetical protein CFP56_08073 [Quercus suber]